jgi:hypothetical protein
MRHPSPVCSKPLKGWATRHLSVILSEAKNPSVTDHATSRTIACEGISGENLPRLHHGQRITRSLHRCDGRSLAPSGRTQAKEGPGLYCPLPRDGTSVFRGLRRHPYRHCAREANQGMVAGEEDCIDRVFQSALARFGCGTTVAYAQPGVILSEAKNLSVTVLAIRKSTERFFASLRMTASGAGAHRTLHGLQFHQYPTLKHYKGAPPEVQNRSKAGPPVQRGPHTSGVILSEAKNLSGRPGRCRWF